MQSKQRYLIDDRMSQFQIDILQLKSNKCISVRGKVHQNFDRLKLDDGL